MSELYRARSLIRSVSPMRISNIAIALALVHGGRNRTGENVDIPVANGRAIRAIIADPVFIDPDGARQNV